MDAMGTGSRTIWYLPHRHDLWRHKGVLELEEDARREEGQTDRARVTHTSVVLPSLGSPCPAAPGAGGTEVVVSRAGPDRDAPPPRCHRAGMGTGSRGQLLGQPLPAHPKSVPRGHPAMGQHPAPLRPPTPSHREPRFAALQALPPHRVFLGWTHWRLRPPPTTTAPSPTHRQRDGSGPPDVSQPLQAGRCRAAPRAAELNEAAAAGPSSRVCPSSASRGGSRG